MQIERTQTGSETKAVENPLSGNLLKQDRLNVIMTNEWTIQIVHNPGKYEPTLSQPKPFPTAWLLFISDGELTLSLPGETKILLTSGKNYCVYLSPHTQARIIPNTSTTTKLIGIQLEWKGLIAALEPKPSSRIDQPSCEGVPLTHPLLPAQLRLIEELMMSSHTSKMYPFEAQAKIASLLWAWAEQQTSFFNPKAGATLKPDEINRVNQIQQLLLKSPEATYRLMELAHSVGTNDATLKKHFKQHVGMTVFAYLTACRMEKAKRLLQTHAKIVEIANEVGYKHSSHFSAAFLKYEGKSPAEWRKGLG